MKQKTVISINVFLLLIAFLISKPTVSAQTSMNEVTHEQRQKILFDDNWLFHHGNISGAEKIDFNDKSWRNLSLPHDWSIEGEFNKNAVVGGNGGYLPVGIGWYRKYFSIQNFSQKIWIEFDGSYMNTEVWLNGKYVGKHVNGYISFYFDLTPFLKKGKNIIAVKVDNSIQTNSRWYSGSGIYRHVWLNIANPLHISQWGTNITTTAVNSSSADVSIKTMVENNLIVLKEAVLKSQIFDNSDNIVAESETPFNIDKDEKKEISQVLKVPNPKLWSDHSPDMYILKSVISVNGKTIDQYETSFGIRSIEFSSRKGFLLNGKSVKINGVCLHHDAGCLGAAVPVKVWERRLKILKRMGCNGIRTSHNPVAPEFMDLCDKMGFLVMAEPFDEWTEAKGNTTSAYHKYYNDNWKKDVTWFIRRDRNHPSIVIWSAGNEVPDQSVKSGQEVFKKLLNVFHTEDPTRPVTVANDRIAADDNPVLPGFLELQDVVGYNYVDRWHKRRELYYSLDKMAHPDWKMIGTENVSIAGIRGEYSLENNFATFSFAYNTSMIRAEQLWKFTAVHDYVCGDFMWTGIDYLGESFWPGKSSFSGVIDMAGFPKDGYYFYQSQWTNEPMVHIFPHWNWKGREGEIVPVIAFTNCDAVELFLNGKSYGEKRLDFPRPGNSKSWLQYDEPPVNPTTADLHLSWDIPYKPGTLKAVGKKKGEIVYTSTVQTAGDPVAVRLNADKKTFIADGQDVVHLEVKIVDKKGILVPGANNDIQFKVNGNARLIGVENGNPRDHTKPSSIEKKVFNGMILGMIQSTDRTGNITIKVSSPGLENAEVEFVSVKD